MKAEQCVFSVFPFGIIIIYWAAKLLHRIYILMQPSSAVEHFVAYFHDGYHSSADSPWLQTLQMSFQLQHVKTWWMGIQMLSKCPLLLQSMLTQIQLKTIEKISNKRFVEHLYNKTIEVMFQGINVFWAWLKAPKHICAHKHKLTITVIIITWRL